MDNEKVIWDYFKSQGLNDFGVAGLMGNLYAESGLNPHNLQNTGNQKLDLSDDQYTAAVDNNKYKNFVKDRQGYGLAQWTYWSRKQNLLNYANSLNCSIGDLQMQLNFLMKELNDSYLSVLRTLQNGTSVLECSNVVLLNFERPADQSEYVQKKRAGFGRRYYNKYSNCESDEMTVKQFAELFMELRKGLHDNNCQNYSLTARNWAVAKGLIVGGGTLENSEPNYMWQDFITREQMVTVLHRFAQL